MLCDGILLYMDCVHTISCGPHAADNDLGTQGAQALAPELGKLTQLQSLNLEGEGPARRSCIRVLSADTDCVIWSWRSGHPS